MNLSAWDVAVALSAPPLAIFLRLPEQLTTADGRYAALLYTLLAFPATVVSLTLFRNGSELTRYFSAIDALNVVKASACAVFLTAGAMFLMVRLDGVSRTTPVIHLLILCLLLLAGRIVSRLRNSGRIGASSAPPQASAQENILVVGVNRAALLYIQFIDELARGHRRIVAVLDEREKFKGRLLAGHIVVGTPMELARIVSDFEVHGVHVARIVLAIPSSQLSDGVRNVLEELEQTKQIVIENLEQHIYGPQQPRATEAPPAAQLNPAQTNPYWRYKRAFDCLFALGLLIALSPVIAAVYVVVAMRLGTPVLFWQQRLGRGGQPMQVLKFRTLLDPFDSNGNLLGVEQRQNYLGRILRSLRLDELPQLLNILVGTMSLVGPRPLLPVDQPTDSDLRLMVAPGLTGWAQVNGGTLLSKEEKGAMDDWYVENASAGLDLRIMLLTLRVMITGERRNEQAIAAAVAAADKRRHRTDGGDGSLRLSA